jgi:hypothetical protein
MNDKFLKQILSTLDCDAFSKYVFELWKLENSSEANNYIEIEPLPKIGEGVLEQYFYQDDFAGYHLIIPFYLPLELFQAPEDVGVANPELLSGLKRYKRIMKQRIDEWKFWINGNYTLPYFKFVTNFSGLEEEVYFNLLIPKFQELLNRLKIDALVAVGSCDSFVKMNPTSAAKAFENFLGTYQSELSISLQDGRFKIDGSMSEKYLTCGVLKQSKNPCESLLITKSNCQIIHEFESLLNEKTPERNLENFIKNHYKEIFGNQYDRVESQLWLKFPDLDIGNDNRRIDIFLRNSIERDWEIFELKKCKKKIARTERGIPIFVAEVIAAIQQLRNYQDILLQNTVREHFRNEGIEYFYPEMRLVIGRKPNISVNQWRRLKSSHENNIKILTYDSLLEEMSSRFQIHKNLGME